MTDPNDSIAAALAQTTAARTAIETKIEGLENELANLRRELRAVQTRESVLADFVSASSPTATPEPDDELSEKDWSKYQRTDAVVAAVNEIQRSKQYASPGDIEAFFAARKRTDDKNVIGAALSYLRKSNKLVNVSRGLWKTIPEDDM